MDIKVDELLERAFVLNVDDVRYRTFARRFEHYGLTPLPRVFQGFYIQNGVYRECGFIKTCNTFNCCMSHIALVSMAKTLGMEYMCVFEDDALPRKDIAEKLKYFLTGIPDDADMVKMGSLGARGQKVHVDSKYDIFESNGSHAYIIFRKYYDEFLRIASFENPVIDTTCMNSGGSRRIYETNEMLFVQDDTLFDYSIHANPNSKALLSSTGVYDNFEIGRIQ